MWRVFLSDPYPMFTSLVRPLNLQARRAGQGPVAGKGVAQREVQGAMANEASNNRRSEPCQLLGHRPTRCGQRRRPRTRPREGGAAQRSGVRACVPAPLPGVNTARAPPALLDLDVLIRLVPLEAQRPLLHDLLVRQRLRPGHRASRSPSELLCLATTRHSHSRLPRGTRADGHNNMSGTWSSQSASRRSTPQRTPPRCRSSCATSRARR